MVFKCLLACFLTLFYSQAYCQIKKHTNQQEKQQWDIGIHDHGYWYGSDAKLQHHHDPKLADALVDFFSAEEALTIVDFGCGPAKYVSTLVEYGFDCIGYDGHPDTYENTNGLAGVIDLGMKFDLAKRFDWVLCLEVGEHLPKQFEKILLDNLDRHNNKGIVLSWAVRGQGGYGHFNEKNNDEVKKIMKDRGYENDVEAEEMLRSRSQLPWFRNTVMVFRKASAL